MNAKLNMDGTEELEAAMEAAKQQYGELHKAIVKIHTALNNLELEINQPPAGTDD